MSILRIMSSPVVTVNMDDPLTHVKRLFDKSGFHHLLVVDGKSLVGVISDRDLLRNISPYFDTIAQTNRDAATVEHAAHQIMTRSLITLSPDDKISDAVLTFNSHKISCIPIVDENHHPVGIVSWRDVMQALGKVRKSQ